ncbi:hypothetical protein [Paenibacillus sp. MMS20-IR301]|uniref:hypothetical protein n=1 Tax=Paenibacillus sp. MMS20-IR301 TaxID=2895946 RepID=UPI0028E9CAA6|nr:hypothetical protein [Paenibacillus sp. MMS20-IR301]WNS44050.1 hypothetical protein LOS79_01935 [Paenibacillus sp. MMS20-IR301]
MLTEINYPIKNPSRIETIIGMIIIISCHSILLSRLWDQRGIFYVLSITVLLCLVLLFLAFYITFFKKPTGLSLSNEQIFLNGNIINPKDIKVIMIRGYFKPVIGILPHKRRIVPLNMAFRYSEDEDKGISNLKSWATMNNVKMVNRSFQTWI